MILRDRKDSDFLIEAETFFGEPVEGFPLRLEGCLFCTPQDCRDEKHSAASRNAQRAFLPSGKLVELGDTIARGLNSSAEELFVISARMLAMFYEPVKITEPKLSVPTERKPRPDSGWDYQEGLYITHQDWDWCYICGEEVKVHDPRWFSWDGGKLSIICCLCATALGWERWPVKPKLTQTDSSEEQKCYRVKSPLVNAVQFFKKHHPWPKGVLPPVGDDPLPFVRVYDGIERGHTDWFIRDGDWIVTDTAGVHHIVDPDVFERDYECVSRTG